MESSEHPKGTRRSLVDAAFRKLHRMKASDAFLFKLAVFAAGVFLLIYLIGQSTGNTVEVPAQGGTFKEGILGTPRFANPVLAVTRADRDLSELIYDGLMTLGKDGLLVPDIAKSVTVSEDGLTYNVLLREDVRFHDGEGLTARDVAFTVGRIQDPLLASPLRSNFDGVSVEEIGDFELNFVLPEAYAPFIENLTFGILPEHIWKDAGSEEFPFSQHNSEAVGAGPYKVKEIIRNASGIPEKYVLAAYDAYHLGKPRIDTIELFFFPTEDRIIQAFQKKTIDAVVGVDPARLPAYGVNEMSHHVERIPRPRTFAVFINQNKSPALKDLSARRALDVAIDRTALVGAALLGYGQPLSSPIPRGFGIEVPEETPSSDIEAAREILREGGWEMNAETGIWEKEVDETVTPLSFSLSTVNNSAFEATAEFLRESWNALGAAVDVKQFEQSDLTQAIIRPRDYEALLFGTELGRSLDLYSFWHSSQRIDPGLNVSLYTNITTDSILTEMRRSTDVGARNEAAGRFVEEIKKETPAIFLYTPDLIYIFPNKVTGATFRGVGEIQERFGNVHEWFIETESVWPIFTE